MDPQYYLWVEEFVLILMTQCFGKQLYSIKGKEIIDIFFHSFALVIRVECYFNSVLSMSLHNVMGIVRGTA